MCSGAMVFLDSCSHISLASDEIKWMNSSKWLASMEAGEGTGIGRLPTQHSITKSRVSLAQTTSLGSSSWKVI